MMSDLTRRRVLIAGGAAMATMAIANTARSQPAALDEIRIGSVVPSSTGALTTVITSINDFTGDAARQGALLGEARIGELASLEGTKLVLTTANAPTPQAASRAGNRLVATREIDALIGGVGDGQAEVLSTIAEAARIPFFNVGSPMSRRLDCNRFTFHLEASEAMYLDAMVSFGAAQGYRRWFIVNETGPAGEASRLRAVDAIGRHGAGGEAVGAISAIAGQPIYHPQLNAAQDAGADTILLLLRDLDQIVFYAQQENMDAVIPVIPFPHPNTQTRDYINASRDFAPATNPHFRVALWDATLSAAGAAEFNERYISQWGSPADSPAWAAYHAVKILYEAIRMIGTANGDAVVDYLENSGAEFDILKGPGTSFRSWDHQLRQPLYVVRVDQDAPWDLTVPSTRVAAAQFDRAIPNTAGDGGITERLDQFGDGLDGPICTVG